MPTVPTPPAEGERRAVRGFSSQYVVAASRILRSLRSQNLAWVRLADPDAGRVDDFQLGSLYDVHAFQVKWSHPVGTFTFADGKRSKRGQPALINQLADGWKRLRTIHSGRRVTVHLVTNDIPSTADRLIQRVRGVRGSRAHFAEFLAKCWIPAQTEARAGRDPNNAVSADWQVAWEAWRQTSALTHEEWRIFVGDCELEFGVQDPREGPIDALRDAEIQAWGDDLQQLAQRLFQLVGHPTSRKVEFSRSELLALLNWSQRVELVSRHEFPDPDIPYRAVRETVAEFENALTSVSGGYIAVLGSPGSGKSTLLTQTLRYRERVVRYYAYVPPSLGSNVRRGEARNFLHDVVVALENQGIYVGPTLPSNDEDRLRERLAAQFQALHRTYAQTGRKTILLVDGLDHIPREQRPVRSLLRELPEPHLIPDGVIIVLGSQTDHLADLPSAVLGQLELADRRIWMKALDRSDVVEIIRGASLTPEPSQDEQAEIYRLSAGHPLALNYILNRIRLAPIGASVIESLNRVSPFEERIDQQYLEHWRAVQADFPAVRLFALLARARSPIRLDWITRWADGPSLHRVTTEFAHYFRHESQGQWSFFHNSFRIFLIDQTRAVVALQPETSLYGFLAERAAAANTGDPELADELYYAARAGQHERVVELADSRRWRTEFLSGRPPRAIIFDTEDAIDSAAKLRDVVGLTRALLANAEFSRRDYYARQLPLAEVLVGAGNTTAAVRWLVEGTELLVPEVIGLRAAGVLDDAGAREEAIRIFELAEPIEVLVGLRTREHHDHREFNRELDEWVKVAPRFRSLADLLQCVERLAVPVDRLRVRQASEADDDVGQVDMPATSGLRARILRDLANVYDDLGRDADADALRRRLSLVGEPTILWQFWSLVDGWRIPLAAGDPDLASNRFAALVGLRNQMEDTDLGPREQIAIAEGLIRILGDSEAARREVAGVSQPKRADPLSHTDGKGFNEFADRFSLNRVLAALGDTTSLSAIVPDPVGEESVFLTHFERAVIIVARLIGRTWTGDRISVSSFLAYAQPLLRLFAKPPRANLFLKEGWSLGYSAREDLYLLLIRAAALHGPEVAVALRDSFELEWNNAELSDNWPADLRRKLIVEIASTMQSDDWATEQLRFTEPTHFTPGDLERELEAAAEQASAWLAVDNIPGALETLETILAGSFSAENKQYELDSWIQWAAKANDLDKTNAASRVAHFARAVGAIRDVEGHHSAAEALLKTACETDVRVGTALLRSYIRDGELSWSEAVRTYLSAVLNCAPQAVGHVSICYQNLGLKFDRHPDTQLATAVARISLASNEPFVRATFEQLKRAVDVVALSSNREVLRAALVGATAEAARLNTDSYDQRPLAGIEGVTASAAELAARIQSVTDVEDIIRRAKPDSYLPWERLLEGVVETASKASLVQLEAVIPHTDQTWQTRIRIAERLADFGELTTAETIAQSVLESTPSAGWHRRYDGGSRERTLTLLARIDAASAREKAWLLLADDLRARRVDAFNLATNWYRIVPLLVEDVPVLAITAEIEHYVWTLVENSNPPPPPALPPVGTADDPLLAATEIVSFIGDYLDHPAGVFAHGAQRAYLDMLMLSDVTAQRVASLILSRPNHLRGLLLVLDALSRKKPDALSFAVDKLTSRWSDKDASARFAIERIMENASREIPKLQRPAIKQPLPPAYAVMQAGELNAEPIRQPRSEDFLPRPQNAAALVRAFQPTIRVIARYLNVAYDSVARDVASRWRELGIRLDLPEDEEPLLRAQLDSLRLHPGFRRPQMMRVEQAISEAVADLQDRGWLGPESDWVFKELLRRGDAAFLAYRPSPRPKVVSAILERANATEWSDRYVRQSWTECVSAAVSAVGKPLGADADRIVVAEETWTRWLDWKRATETRIGAWRQSSMPPLTVVEETGADLRTKAAEALHSYCDQWSHVVLQDYLITEPGEALIVRQTGFRFETPANFWLAINPSIASALGWRASGEGLFRWVDEAGEVMAESIWWADGWRQMEPPEQQDEVGEGWLVVASPSAVKALIDFEPLSQYVRVEREAGEQPTSTVNAAREMTSG